MEFQALIRFGKTPDRLKGRKMTPARFKQFAARHNASMQRKAK